MGHVNAAHPSAVAARTSAWDGISRALRTVGLGVLCDLGLVDPGTVLRFPLRCISGTLVLAVVLRSLQDLEKSPGIVFFWLRLFRLGRETRRIRRSQDHLPASADFFNLPVAPQELSLALRRPAALLRRKLAGRDQARRGSTSHSARLNYRVAHA